MDRFHQNVDNTGNSAGNECVRYHKIYYKNAVPDSRVLVFLTGFCLDFYKAGLLEYVMYKRLGQLFFLLVCATSVLKSFFSYTILGWGGFEMGVMVFTLVYQYGLKGLLFSASLLVPHGIFFILVFLLIFHKNQEGDEKTYHNCGVITENRSHNKFTKVKKAIVIFTLWFTGILSEIYINPEIIKKIALLFK